MKRHMKRWLGAVVGLWIGCAAASASAASLKVASGFDPQTMDPHALALL